MTILYRLRGLVRWLFRRDEIERALDIDLADYIERSAAEKMRAGMPEADAWRAARIELGGVEQTKERVRATLAINWVETFVADLSYALRALRRSKTFTALAVLTLALGIGVNTAIFSVVNAVILKPVPFPEPNTLVQLTSPINGRHYAGASPAKFMFWRAQKDVFSDIAAYRSKAMNYTGGDMPTQVRAEQVSEEYFSVFGAKMSSGRPFTAAEDLPGGPKVVVISDDFWRQRLGGAPNVIGKTISLSGGVYTIVGAVSPDFDTRGLGRSGGIDVWVPFQLDPNTTDAGDNFRVAARLKPGVSLAEARARVQASTAIFLKRYPHKLPKGEAFSVESFQQAIVGLQVRRVLLILFGAVAFVLLIACANVASLLLVRATARRGEIAIRSVLGAGRGRIVRQLLTESVLLSLAGGVLGLIAGFAGMRVLLRVNTAGLPRLGPGGSLLGMDWRVVTFTLALSFATGIAFGLVPALVGSRMDLNTIIKDAGSRSGSGFRQDKTRSVLVMAELGLAVVLSIGAALLIRTSHALNRVDPGFDPTNVLVMRTSLNGPRFQTTAAVEQTVRRALGRVRGMPGVVAAAAAGSVPLQGGGSAPFKIEGRRSDKGPLTGGAGIVGTSAAYFKTFGISVLHGRAFTDRDDAGAPPVIVINEAMAKQFWPKAADPLAARILIGGGVIQLARSEPVRQVIGVVGDVRRVGLNNHPPPIMYVPLAQLSDTINASNLATTPMAWIVRTRVESGPLSKRIQEAIRQATGLPVTGVKSMKDIVSISVSRQRLNMLLMSIFGASALLLAAIGIYGLIAYWVQQRTQEIGIRMALGASAERVKRMVLRQGILLIGIGIAAGLVAAYYTASLLASLLFEVKPRDIPVFAAVPAALAFIALAAVWVPARRASRVDPLKTLRHE